MIANEPQRGFRPDGTWEVWMTDRPANAIVGLGRFQSWLIWRVLRLGKVDKV